MNSKMNQMPGAGGMQQDTQPPGQQQLLQLLQTLAAGQNNHDAFKVPEALSKQPSQEESSKDNDSLSTPTKVSQENKGNDTAPEEEQEKEGDINVSHEESSVSLKDTSFLTPEKSSEDDLGPPESASTPKSLKPGEMKGRRTGERNRKRKI